MAARSNPRICIAEKLFAAEVLLAQSAGEGKRLGRSFSSPSGGLYFSIPIPPSFISDPALITAKAAVAVSTAIEKNTGLDCKIKWGHHTQRSYGT